ncbi:efflux RND transporter permease subunit, partial [Staphylococcus aureus]|uniref:efflux RND transporter permease subunit n=1 Tax=Staphylococcus aureus TaxID=1280 RepID=UPI0039BE80A3
AAAVATPLERQFSGLQGLDTMSSMSSVGTTRIVLQFALSRNVDAAAQDVQNAVSQAAAVATPLERQFSGLQGLDTMSSMSSVGTTRIVLQFALSRYVDAAAQDVQNAVSQAAALLPREINPAEIQKEDPSAAPIMHLI